MGLITERAVLPDRDALAKLFRSEVEGGGAGAKDGAVHCLGRYSGYPPPLVVSGWPTETAEQKPT